jgi:DNA polymerase-3 subunit delta'
VRAYLQGLVGNAALRTRLGGELERGAFSHAYILEGAEGAGKHTLAREIILSLACEHRTDGAYPLPCGECPTCRKIAAGNCPDVVYVSREDGKATLGVDVIRAMREGISVLPNDLDVRVYVIEDAQTMTTQAQNALLLTLEEPPSFVRFLLLSTKADALLETIRSRAPVLRMQPVTEEELSAYLTDPARGAVARNATALRAEDAEEYAALLRMAGGRIGRALELLEAKRRAPVMARRADVQALCELLANGKRRDGLLTLLYSFSTVRDELCARLSLFVEALRDLIALSCVEAAPLVFFTDREAAADLAARFLLKELFSFVEATEQALAQLRANANTRLAITHYLCRLTA